MKQRLITAALPYVNNIPHLGNLVQVLSADVFARYCRAAGYETLYVCGTDEYGTATETRALTEKITPKELCDKYNAIHTEIYEWFNISFDHFGRTSTKHQTEIVQRIFKDVDKAGYISEKTITQLFCKSCDRFLADRYVHGECPHCGYEEARGDQCENCGKLLDPTELINPRCGTCQATPEEKSTRHLFLDLPKVLPLLEKWIKETSAKGFWAKNAVKMTESWIRDGLKERCITRDLKWGIPVPKPGFENKVFYVWFDAPIGYISITKDYTTEWEKWWLNPENVELFQFIGKDNIPFHTVIFPASLLASGENWTKLHHMSSSEYLNYEDTKFSKSKGIGIFGNDCQDTGIAADVWRFYLYYTRPEKSDARFVWDDFQEKVNSELIGNVGNLINRTLSFINRFFEGTVPAAKPDTTLWETITKAEEKITTHLDRAELRDALHEIFLLSGKGNKTFQDGEPWRVIKEDKEKAGELLTNLLYLIKDLAIMLTPFIPTASQKIFDMINYNNSNWSDLGSFEGLITINPPEILFEKIEKETVETLREQFAGSQDERKERKENLKATKKKQAQHKNTKNNQENEEEMSLEELFHKKVDIRTAKITGVDNHPEADKLYVIELDCGDNEPRTIVSGLVDSYKKEELINQTILVVYNLKPAKLRGIKSNGMLLAAEDEEQNLEVLMFSDTKAGVRVHPKGMEPCEIKGRIGADKFFKIPIMAKDHKVMVGDTPLCIGGKEILTKKIVNGEVG